MQNKSAQFGEADRGIARIAKALSHPARVRILRLLAEYGRCFTGTLVHELPLSQATVSQHLRELRQAGLIRGEVEGPATCYCIDYAALTTVSAEFGALFSGVCCSEPTVRIQTHNFIGGEK
ncbi:MAG: metalloregulator ArsR/SmtB family transcription factor [Spirochaeta sp.]|nr:metalloregulator ArsR/SmtB family transcription factor [Spirochaeta sp.]